MTGRPGGFWGGGFKGLGFLFNTALKKEKSLNIVKSHWMQFDVSVCEGLIGVLSGEYFEETS